MPETFWWKVVRYLGNVALFAVGYACFVLPVAHGSYALQHPWIAALSRCLAFAIAVGALIDMREVLK